MENNQIKINEKRVEQIKISLIENTAKNKKTKQNNEEEREMNGEE